MSSSRTLACGRSAAAGLALLVVTTLLVLATAPAAAQETGARGVKNADVAAALKKARVQRLWAVVIGVSDYAHSDRGISDLRYAHVDANALADVLSSDRFGAGGVPKHRLTVLTNDQATLDNTRQALEGLVDRVAKDDLVIVFFAGHGAPDPSDPEGGLYLLTHDTDPTKVASTALPMKELHATFSRLASDRVVLFADACHSAGIVRTDVGYRSNVNAQNLVHRFLGEMSKIRRNRVVITSSDANERSLEGERWGHGLFTWALLDALGGAADKNERGGNGDGIVQLGELVRHLRAAVEVESGFQQHPVVSGEMDERLPLTLVSAAASSTVGKTPKLLPAGPQVLPPFKKSRRDKPFDLGSTVIVAPSHGRRPATVYILQSRREVLTLLDREADLAPEEVSIALAHWQELDGELGEHYRSVRTTEEQLRPLQDLISEKAPGERAEVAATLRRFLAELREQLRDRQLQVDLASARALAALDAWHDEVGRLPTGFWYAHLHLERHARMRAWFSAEDAYTEQLEAFENGEIAEIADPPEIDWAAIAADFDAFLDGADRAHPSRKDALYFRAILAQEQGGEPIEVAGHCLRAVAEYPDHPDARNLYLRMADTYFDLGDPKLLPLAAESYLAVLDKLDPDDELHDLALYKLAWTYVRMGDRTRALDRMVQLVGVIDGRDGPASAELRPEAVDWAGILALESGAMNLVWQSRLAPATRAEITAAAAEEAREVGDTQTAATLLAEALKLAPTAAEAFVWDLRRAELLQRLGKLEEAADVLEKRFARFGPRSDWFRAQDRVPPKRLESLARDAERAIALRTMAKRAATRNTATTNTDARRAFRRHVGALQRCYERAISADPDHRARYQVALRWGSDGRLEALSVESRTAIERKTGLKKGKRRVVVVEPDKSRPALSPELPQLTRCLEKQLTRLHMPRGQPGSAIGTIELEPYQ